MTQEVDLSTLSDYIAHVKLCPLINALREKKRIVVIAGAGISASAGIPTFDSMPGGSKTLFDLSIYNSTEATARFNMIMCDMYHRIEAASPTQFHLLIAALAEEGRLQRLYTQNIDGIDTQLPPLKTLIPLLKRDWPNVIQLHGDLRTVRCEMFPCTHLSRFDPALFASGSPSYCAKCEETERLHEGKRRERPIPVIRPRICLYQDWNYPDADAISMVMAADVKTTPDAVIVVGTALKVNEVKIFARKICHKARKDGGFTAWINLKAPPSGLDCFDLVVKGDCENVAMHVSSWWLKECPSVLNNAQIQRLQEKCNLFIARSAREALNRAFAEVDDRSLLQVLQQQEIKSRVLGVQERGEAVFVSAEKSQSSKLNTWRAVNHNVERATQHLKSPSHESIAIPPKSLDVLPKLPDCWKIEMLKRLKNVVVQETETGRESLSLVTKITDLGYKEKLLETSLWRLKPGEYLNSEILNAYLKLLRVSKPTNIDIQGTDILNVNPNLPLRRLNTIIETGTYSIFIPVHEGSHWTFAVLTSEDKDGPVKWEYYDSLGGEPPEKVLRWLKERLPGAALEKVTGSPSPGQRNGVDCGLFMLIGIRLISAGERHLSQAQSDVIIPSFRQRVLAELLASSLDPSINQFKEFRLKEEHAVPSLSQVSPARGVCEKGISTVISDQNSPVDSPMGGSPSGSFNSTPSASNSREDTEVDSSYALDESEEELVRVKRRTKKAHKAKKSPEQIACTFAEGTSIVKVLREAVFRERASQNGQKIENIGLADLWLMISTEKQALNQRYMHYEFSRQFWAKMKGFNRVPHQDGRVSKATISEMMSKLDITNRTSWKYILQLARRASVWTDLVDIFKNDLQHPSVVLCAVPDATYTLETMTLANRKAFLESICSRLAVPDNGILARLKAADSLYRAVIDKNLPASGLRIEASEDMAFEEAVSISK